jgi:translation initiation factor IF-3
LQILKRSDARNYSKVRLVGEGRNDIVTIDQVFREADEVGLDVVIVGDTTDPPVVRIQDYKKLEYEKKKAKSKQARTSELKEIQLKVNISDHDLATKVSAIERFLARGDKVKLSVRLKGRERENPERAQQLLDKVATQVSCKMSRVPGPIGIAILEAVK